jgi:hypothetical protein
MTKVWSLVIALLDWGLNRLFKRNTSDALDAELPPDNLRDRLADKLSAQQATNP